MVSLIEYLGIPLTVGLAICGFILIAQIINEILSLCGKLSPKFKTITGYFKKKKQQKKEMQETLSNVRTLLDNVNSHYDADNIKKRDDWMQWVNDQAEVYNDSIALLEDRYDSLLSSMETNNKITQDLFLDFKRNMILECAARVNNPQYNYSKEYFNKIFKVYADYEKYITEHNLKNGEVDIAYNIIKKAYEHKLANNLFTD